MEDEAGGDEKLLAVPRRQADPALRQGRTIITDLPEITLKQIEHFFAHYKDLEPNKWVQDRALGRRRGGAPPGLEGIERAKAAKAETPA